VSFRRFALPEFWKRYDALSENTRALAPAKYALFEREPFHPSLGLKQKGEVSRSMWAAAIAPSRTHWRRVPLVLDRFSRGLQPAPAAREVTSLRPYRLRLSAT
jgi:hypothetical protein